MEELEARVVPTSFTWDGDAAPADPGWSNPLNWVSDTAPNPAGGDELLFPNSGAPRATVNDFSNAEFDSISISGSNYTLSGNAIQLGRAAVSGGLNIGAGAAGNTISFNIAVGAVPGSPQSYSVVSGGAVTIAGQLSGTTGATIIKSGVGTLTLTADNSGFTGPIQVNDAGVLAVTNRFALGSAAAPTTINNTATLQLSNITGGPITEPLLLNGLGLGNAGAVNNLAGNTTLAGTVTLSTQLAGGVAIGAQANTVLTITGVINDTGGGQNLFKEGAGEIRLASPTGNTYRGQTQINDGVLTALHPLALGNNTSAPDSPATGTIVNVPTGREGQLRVEYDPTVYTNPNGKAGFVVLNEYLALNGNGPDNKGSLYNAAGNNNWAGQVILGFATPNAPATSVTIGVADTTNLTVSGVVSSPNGMFFLTKILPGRLIFDNANTYTGATSIFQGILTIRDSLGLGSTLSGTSVSNGAALELEVERATNLSLDPNTNTNRDPRGRNLDNDSVSGDENRLFVSEPLTIAGRGLANTGALRSVSGINEYRVGITLAGSVAAIGVDQDQRAGHPTPDASYFTADYSLTSTAPISGGRATEFAKRDAGHLILGPGVRDTTGAVESVANPYTGTTLIEQGWVTIQNQRSLGADITTVDRGDDPAGHGRQRRGGRPRPDGTRRAGPGHPREPHPPGRRPGPPVRVHQPEGGPPQPPRGTTPGGCPTRCRTNSGRSTSG